VVLVVETVKPRHHDEREIFGDTLSAAPARLLERICRNNVIFDDSNIQRKGPDRQITTGDGRLLIERMAAMQNGTDGAAPSQVWWLVSPAAPSVISVNNNCNRIL